MNEDETKERAKLGLELAALKRRLEGMTSLGSCGNGVKTTHVTIKDMSTSARIAFTLMPFATAIPSMVLSWKNTCMSHTPQFRYSVLIPYTLLWVIMVVHMYMYDSTARFCSKSLMRAHVLEELVVLCSIAAGVLFIDLYAYEFAWYFAFLAVIFFYLSIGYFITSFWHKHSRFCTESMSAHCNVMNKSFLCCSYEFLFVVLSISFCANIVLVTTLPVYFAEELHNSTARDSDPNCV
jgi:hypothetical protein